MVAGGRKTGSEFLQTNVELTKVGEFYLEKGIKRLFYGSHYHLLQEALC
jgi:hypothetical protein